MSELSNVLAQQLGLIHFPEMGVYLPREEAVEKHNEMLLKFLEHNMTMAKRFKDIFEEYKSTTLIIPDLDNEQKQKMRMAHLYLSKFYEKSKNFYKMCFATLFDLADEEHVEIDKLSLIITDFYKDLCDNVKDGFCVAMAVVDSGSESVDTETTDKNENGYIQICDFIKEEHDDRNENMCLFAHLLRLRKRIEYKKSDFPKNHEVANIYERIFGCCDLAFDDI